MVEPNFRDPLGLAWRMLRSPDPTARSVLLREALGVAVRPLDALLAAAERRRLGGEAPDGSAPCVLVVGGPRSGTTLVYQLLAAHLRVSYTSNWTGAFPRSPISAGRLVPRWQREPVPSTRSFFGSVRGPGGPNDAFAVWDRWFGGVRGEPTPLRGEAIEELRAFVSAWNAAFGRPLLNKNNRNALAIEALAEALPGAVFVAVERDPVFVAQSLLEARALVQGDAQHGWGLLAEDAEPGVENGAVEAVCNQVRAFQRRIREQADAVEPARVVRVGYEAFCRDPRPTLAAVAAACPAAGPVRGTPPPLRSTDRRRIDAADFAGLERRLGERRKRDPHGAA
ncbi:sulfotransferase [Phycisphaera mikurensis]|uniref:Sulfotransferase n=1 Tax=Phycisphaera mikurensis (strain NBRC 102666 / KCTC 22515 / FYK2301M01) TaxID=1142394 RepID=I0IAH9_PHYMF|nr:sulfotransferase [Phycisphaera mikurensis]MBB6441736.1 LPS sulfotransferase NodH [Phycisphaera mikurensis]BAM02267.1 hypothetical protein PSMK_01080 [Phycisphaera mikurensis NBRC 102666]